MTPATSQTIVTVERVTKTYALGNTTVEALRGVDLSIARGEFVAIAGPSGSGKTTLLNLIGCIERPTAGMVRVHEQDVGRLSPDALAAIRARQLGMIFQQFNLLPVLTAVENVEYPLLAQRIPRNQQRQRAEQALARVGLSAFLHHKPVELSGGQQQRVAIARALVTEPLLILADEPTANLDYATGQDILGLMKALNQERGTTFLFSTHDPNVMQLASRVLTLRDGVIIGTSP